MISTIATKIWTPYGYSFAEDLYVGEKVISFNPKRGVCEYDEIYGVETRYMRRMGFGLYSKSMRQVLTPEHPLLMWDLKYKTLNLVPIEDRFMTNMAQGKNLCVLQQGIFEPYKRTQSIEDIKWSARTAATVAKHRFAPINIDDVVCDLGGYEAQIWLDTFFHWNKMVRARNWMAAVHINNRKVKEYLLNIAPRAGVGVKIDSLNKRPTVYITPHGYLYPTSVDNWFKKPIDEQMFNVTTKNGNVLVKTFSGTYLAACNKTGE